MVQPLVLEATRAESVASLSIAGVDSRSYTRQLDALAASLEEEGTTTEEEEEQQQHTAVNENHESTLATPASLDSSDCGEECCDNHEEEEEETKETKQDLLAQNEASEKEEHTALTKPEFGPPKESVEFVMGDHVYQWCFYGPFPYQHHAIVMEVWQEEEQEDDAKQEDFTAAPKQRIRVADFSNWTPKEGQNGHDTTALGRSFARDPVPAGSEHATYQGVLRTYECDAQDWHKVQYEAGFWKRHFSWSGTCTSTASDPPAMVRARVQFLVDHPEVIPCYNSIQSNCECVALWCKTGQWCTLQAASWLSTTAAGQAKSAVTMAGAVTAAQVPVTVPAAGVWGWMGYTTTQTVALTAAQPLLLPAIAAFGVITVGVPAVSLALARWHWKKMTAVLNEEFWKAAIDQPDLFVECITHWSGQLE